MNFLLQLDTCMACVKQVSLAHGRYLQYQGTLAISAVTVMALELWLLHRTTPARHLQAYGGMMRQVSLLPVDDAVAHQAAVLGDQFRDQRRRMTTVDLLVAATALVHGLTL